MTTYQVIGTSTPRVEGAEKVTGRARYTADIVLPGTLWGATLRSPYPHARITRIDTTAAQQVHGVYAVLTGADVTDGPYGRVIKDIPVLALDRVRFVGERVAAVAAEDEDIAQRALDLIEVEYEELPAVFEPLEAMESGAPLLHPDFNSYLGATPIDTPSNAYLHSVTDRGDPDAAFASADHVIEHTYVTQRQHQGYLESHTVLVHLDEASGRVHVWASTKVPYNAKEALATAAGIPQDRVVLNPTLIGGDFGGKGTPFNLAVAYFLAKASGRPVRMVADYVEEFMAGNPRHHVVIRLKSGVMNDGTIVAHEVQFVVNAGAYAGYKPGGRIGGANQSAGPYRIPNTRIESAHVYTNTVPGGYMRAPGEPQAVFAIESHIDELARELGIDPFEFRLRNLIDEGDEAAFGEVLHDVKVKETLRAAVEAAGYGEPKAPNVGRGIAIGDRGPGGGEGNSAVTLRPDGRVTLGTPIFDQGSGTYTLLKQVVAEELGLTVEDIDLEIWDTDSVNFDSGVAGSRATRVNTNVAYQAAQEAKRALVDYAAEALNCNADFLRVRGNEIVRTDIEETMRWQDLLATGDRTVTGRANVKDTGSTHLTSFAVQVAEVSVDPETGEVRVLNFTTAHDVGRVINPAGHQGQINGGFMQGLGYALMEELRVEDGRVTSLSFGDYKLPSIVDIPPLHTVLLESESGVGPYNIKGIGEPPTTPVAPAIANAIVDAVGVRIRTLPITSEKVYDALRAKNTET